MKAFTLFCLGVALVYGMCSAAMWRVQNPRAPLIEFFTAAHSTH